MQQGIKQKTISSRKQDMTNQKNDRNGRRSGLWVVVLVLQIETTQLAQCLVI
jgi:hypothetical protein